LIRSKAIGSFLLEKRYRQGVSELKLDRNGSALARAP
jgi:hypothetical protein